MKIILKRNRWIQYLAALSIISIGSFCVSCKGTSTSSQSEESELIMKVNAVQEQIMAQGNISEAEEKAIASLCSIMSHDDGLANYNPENRMILKDVEIYPTYIGCENFVKEETRKCFKNKVSSFIKQEFNLSVSQDLNLSKTKEVEAFFIINENGNLTGMKVRDSEVTIQGEILRVLRKIPIMKPASHKGKSVSVLCSIIVKYGNELDVDVKYIPEIPDD